MRAIRIYDMEKPRFDGLKIPCGQRLNEMRCSGREMSAGGDVG